MVVPRARVVCAELGETGQSLDQLEYWSIVRQNYTEHNPSVTISVGPGEWIETANWLYNHWDLLGATMDAYLSVAGNRMNVVMKRLTSISYSATSTGSCSSTVRMESGSVPTWRGTAPSAPVSRTTRAFRSWHRSWKMPDTPNLR